MNQLEGKVEQVVRNVVKNGGKVDNKGGKVGKVGGKVEKIKKGRTLNKLEESFEKVGGKLSKLRKIKQV